MIFEPPLLEGRLIRRYKRFFADIEVNGKTVTAHCPNTGAMTGLLAPNERVWISRSSNPRRKLRWTWELAELPQGFVVGVNTHRANQLVAESLMTGILQPHFAGEITREYRFEDSRFDFAIQGKDVLTVLEVKSVTLGPEGPEPGMGYFPDAVSTRARKHVEALVRARSQGLNAVLLYCVQHTGIRRVAPAVHIDPVYGELLQSAHRAGVRILAVSCDLSPRTWRVSAFIPVDLPSD